MIYKIGNTITFDTGWETDNIRTGVIKRIEDNKYIVDVFHDYGEFEKHTLYYVKEKDIINPKIKFGENGKLQKDKRMARIQRL